MLNERKKDILKIIVEEYIRSVKPVGSHSICQQLNCSSATIRNEMMQLEDLGLLEKTHTSSGRVPSEEGYRYYVNNLMEPKNMTGEDMLKLQQVFQNSSLIIDDAIKQSIELVSEITSYTTVVLGSTASSNFLKKVEVMPLDKNKILTMVITDKGHVEHKMTYLSGAISAHDVKQTVDLINKLLIGTPLDEIREKLEFEVKPIIGKYVEQHEALYNAFYQAFSDITNNVKNPIHLVGKNYFLNQPEYDTIDKVKDIMMKLDDEDVANYLSNEDKNGINIYIGKENELDDNVAIIKTKYNYGDEEKTIAIIGPKRMDYAKVVGLLDYLKNKIQDQEGGK